MIGRSSCSMAKPEDESRQMSVPPALTNARIAAVPASPRPPAYSAGTVPGLRPSTIDVGETSGRMITS